MTVKVRFFAGFREALGTDCLEIEEPFSPATVAGLRQHLIINHAGFAQLMALGGRVRAAVNHDMAEDDTPVATADEVAFFPPVTGG